MTFEDQTYFGELVAIVINTVEPNLTIKYYEEDGTGKLLGGKRTDIQLREKLKLVIHPKVFVMDGVVRDRLPNTTEFYRMLQNSPQPA